MTVAVADSADGNAWERAGRIADVVRAFRAGELAAPRARVVVVRLDRRGRFRLTADPHAAIRAMIERAEREHAREELVDAYEDPPAGYVVLGLSDRRGLTLAHVRPAMLRGAAR